MPDKTPLELAQRILARKEDDTCAQCDPDCMCSEREARRVAAAYMERMTPVDPVVILGKCGCGGCKSINVQYDHKFCPNCGKPLVWK